MTIKLTSRTVLRLKCELCGHQWETMSKPTRCASCRRFGWNGEDRRFRAVQERAADRRFLNGKPVQINHRALLDALSAARGILVNVIADLGPCQHDAEPPHCICNETVALARVNAQIETVKLFTEARP